MPKLAPPATVTLPRKLQGPCNELTRPKRLDGPDGPSELAPGPTRPPTLILASASPRRLMLLRQAGFDPVVRPGHIEEVRRPGESPIDYVRRLALEKARAAPPAAGGSTPPHPTVVLAADTTVFIEGRLLEKPADAAEAASHLKELAGRAHQVATAFCLLDPAGEVAAWEAVVSTVAFRPLTPGEIRRYAATGDGLDKAGAYGIQEAGGFIVDYVQGSYTNIIGLPLTELLPHLRKWFPPDE